ncbi:MAG: DUF1801 domain-containing protein [Pseudomonadota bacterium]
MTSLPAKILDRIASWPEAAQVRLLEIRTIFLDIAAETGPLSETLKWGEPSWLPAKPRRGTTLRVSWFPETAQEIGIFVHCQTTLSGTMQEIYPDTFRYSGNRGLHNDLNQDLPKEAVAHLAQLAFTYHLKRVNVVSKGDSR